jgi:hypothetical protein
MKYYEILIAALMVLLLAALALDGCAYDAAADEVGPVPESTATRTGDPPPSPECVPLASDALVIAPCIDEGATGVEWATATGGFIAGASWKDLAHVRAVAVYCEYASVAVFPYRRMQTPAQLSDGQLRARCDGAHFVHFFP